jgi:hypothetical protein
MPAFSAGHGKVASYFSRIVGGFDGALERLRRRIGRSNQERGLIRSWESS